MKILRVFNNNIVSAILQNGKEGIIQGAGVGFRKKPGDAIEKEKIERVFRLREEDRARFNDMLDQIPTGYFLITEKIMNQVRQELNVELSGQILLALADHIHFAVQREREGIQAPNLLTGEIRQLYKEEYAVACWALEQIEQATGVRLPEDEAGYIALHILNGYLGVGTDNTANTVRLTRGVLDIIEQTFDRTLDEGSLDYTRFMLHIKFLAQRIFRRQQEARLDLSDIYTSLLERDARVQAAISRIAGLVAQEFGYTLSADEKLYLAVHLLRITQPHSSL